MPTMPEASTMPISSSWGTLHGYDSGLADMLIFDMSDQELYQVARSLKIPYRILVARAQIARQNRPQEGHWQ